MRTDFDFINKHHKATADCVGRQVQQARHTTVVLLPFEILGYPEHRSSNPRWQFLERAQGAPSQLHVPVARARHIRKERWGQRQFLARSWPGCCSVSELPVTGRLHICFSFAPSVNQGGNVPNIDCINRCMSIVSFALCAVMNRGYCLRRCSGKARPSTHNIER